MQIKSSPMADAVKLPCARASNSGCNLQSFANKRPPRTLVHEPHSLRGQQPSLTESQPAYRELPLQRAHSD